MSPEPASSRNANADSQAIRVEKQARRSAPPGALRTPQRRLQIRLAGEQNRREAAQAGEKHTQRCVEQQYAAVQSHALQMRQSDGQGGQLRGQDLQRSARRRDSAEASEHCEHKSLGKKLADHLPESRAEGGANGDLSLPLHGAAEQQSAHVGAGDQEHQRHRGHDENQRELVLAWDGVAPRRYGEMESSFGFGVFQLQLARDDRQGALRLAWRDACLDSSDHLNGAGGRGREPERKPHLDFGSGEIELGRHDAGDGERIAGNGNGASDPAPRAVLLLKSVGAAK